MVGAFGLLLSAGGCGGPGNYANLFDDGPGQAGGADNAGTSSNSGHSGYAGTQQGGAGADSAAGGSGSGGGVVGCAFSCGDSGHSGDSSLGGTSAEAGSGSMLNECSAFGVDAVFSPSTQHCYLVVNDQVTFAAASAHCEMLDAHLVTLGSETENDFAWKLLSKEHWIGLKDGKAPKEQQPGKYAWVTGEPLNYTNWSGGQPNASATDCGESNGGGTCYEHCGFQWTGGSHDGQWNDRYCLHTIASICEWDSTR